MSRDAEKASGELIVDDWVERSGLFVAGVLDSFVENELLEGLAIGSEQFWAGLAGLLAELTPRNLELLRRRAELQSKIDSWFSETESSTVESSRDFLMEIGYLESEPAPAVLDVSAFDREISNVAGPQLVVPLSNARYTLNAANARWGSLYDALYGTDAIADPQGVRHRSSYDSLRGSQVIGRALELLDQFFPLSTGSFLDARGITVAPSAPHKLVVELDEGVTGLCDPQHFVGFRVDESRLTVVLRHHGLCIQLVVDSSHPVGAQHPSGLADVIMESAVTTICDCEDSVAAVDADDKVEIYRNWLRLVTGTLSAEVHKDGRSFTRVPAGDLELTSADGEAITLPRRALLLVRNVGIHMFTDAVMTGDLTEAAEGIIDALITVAAAAHDLSTDVPPTNSRAGKIYVVKPKLHGSDEVEFTIDLFEKVEEILRLPPGTVTLGLMDEERRTSLNLSACIAAARSRLFFVNTGFLDRTGDEIHTARAAGPVVRKEAMRVAEWFGAYEDHNVDCALSAGFAGRAQIGKGMWASPDAMANMLAAKAAQLRAGASCAWVPSPTAATLHALHYHEVDVELTQRELKNRPPTRREDLLQLPLLDQTLSVDDVVDEVRNNAQGILGYVVRWVDQGVGCSKVPDIRGVALMEDRATLRISSQHIANWLRHGVVDCETVESVFAEMATVVDTQNLNEPGYRPMSPNLEASHGYRAALDLVFSGINLPNGYTEPVLHHWRRIVKQMASAAPAPLVDAQPTS